MLVETEAHAELGDILSEDLKEPKSGFAACLVPIRHGNIRPY